jgi:asparagine synthase (glutamine-hydrolysing)
MCGIWGAVNLADEQAAEVAARSMCHRGPDDHGWYVSQEPVPVSLANTRLAIIDLSPAGHQPMSNEDGRLWIVYNGEIYNFQPVRERLIEAGHQFKSNSDTEVILHAYEEWGEHCLEHFRGMFALAIWDRKEAKLFAARDRLGIKPLYYTAYTLPNGETRLAFASELKALLATGLAEPTLNMSAIHHYLSFYSIPTPLTILQGVESLPAGHYLTFQDSVLTIKQYWNIPAAEPLALDEAEITRQLRALLEESIRLRMIADVPVGAFLSGGIDSSAVIALMTRISGEQLRTFSIGFGTEGESIDERSEARQLADTYGTSHTEVLVTGQDVRNQLEQIIIAMDQPSGDGLNTYFVSQAAARHVKWRCLASAAMSYLRAIHSSGCSSRQSAPGESGTELRAWCSLSSASALLP